MPSIINVIMYKIFIVTEVSDCIGANFITIDSSHDIFRRIITIATKNDMVRHSPAYNHHLNLCKQINPIPKIVQIY